MKITKKRLKELIKEEINNATVRTVSIREELLEDIIREHIENGMLLEDTNNNRSLYGTAINAIQHYCSEILLSDKNIAHVEGMLKEIVEEKKVPEEEKKEAEEAKELPKEEKKDE